MLTLALTLTVLAAPPRGLTAAHSMELVERVEERLSKWLVLGGDRKELLATPKELEAYFKATGVAKADLKTLVEAAGKEQLEAPELKDFTPAKVLIEFTEHLATVHFFDDAGHRCAVPLLVQGTKAAPRYVLMSGPITDTRTLEKVVEDAKSVEAMQVFADKKTGTWITGARPAPPPADCLSTMKTALKTLFTAEKAYFAEHDGYSKSVSKLGVDLKALGITSAKVSVAGAAPTQTFVIEVGLRGGVTQMNDKGEVTVVGDCSP